MRELRGDNKSLRDKIDAVQATLTQDIKTVEANLSDKINQLGIAVASMRGMQKAMLWILGVLGSLGTVGKFFHWF